MTDTIRTALSQPEPAGLSDEGLPELRGMFERILCVARSSDQKPVGNIELAHRLMNAVVSWDAQRQPVPPEPEEVQKLVKWLQEKGDDYDCIGETFASLKCRRIADLLAQRHPQPVPVSERPWERKGWCDEQGKCWLCGKVEGDWRFLSPTNSGLPHLKYGFTHCLPACALPLPVEVEHG